MKRKISTLLMFAALIFIAACELAPPSPAVAKIGKESISAAELARALGIESSSYDPYMIKEKEYLDKVRMKVLDDMVEESILFQTAEKEGITVTDKELGDFLSFFKSNYSEFTFQKMLEATGTNMRQWTEAKRRRLIADRLVQRDILSKIEVLETEITAYYKKHQSEFKMAERVHARQIVTNDRKTAEDVLKKLDDGANFAAIAKQYSVAPEGKKGGDLGYFERGVFPKVFDDICFELKPGEISDVVRSEYGYHIFKVIEREKPKTAPLTEVRQKVIDLIKQEKLATSYDAWYQALKAKFSITIYPKALDAVEPTLKERK